MTNEERTTTITKSRPRRKRVAALAASAAILGGILTGGILAATTGVASAATARAGLCHVHYGRAWNPAYSGVTAYTDSGAPCTITVGTSAYSGNTGWLYTPFNPALYTVWSTGTPYTIAITNQPW